MEQFKNYSSVGLQEKAGNEGILHQEWNLLVTSKRGSLFVSFITAAPSELRRKRERETMNRLLFQRDHLQSVVLH